MRDFDKAIKASFVVGICAAALAAGCSAGDAGGQTDDGVTKETSISLEGFESFHPQGDAKTYYTGYDGTNDYVAPVAFFADTPPKVSFGDPSVAELQGKPLTITKAMVENLPDALDGKLQLILVKSKKAGETTITATSGKVTQKATLKVTQYSDADVALGQQRYEEGSPSCGSCHAKMAVHNPTVLVDLSDETILGIAVDGKSIEKISTETGAIETLKPNSGAHKWKVTKEERTGLMAYLRSRSLMFQLP
ncbi:MAG: cytochrome c [Labilithrix sp.]|nr:cytochrome c [Labilithrix sp.]MCW5813803.1 cytochrome c [Labilithrix sp.]